MASIDAIPLGVQEQSVLLALNDCTPLPKDLQLLIIEYWRSSYLIAYNSNGFGFKHDVDQSEQDVSCIQWLCFPFDKRAVLPKPIQVPNTNLKIRKLKGGLLIEYYAHGWQLDYYPNICSTNACTHTSIPIDWSHHMAVVGKKQDTLVAFLSNDRSIFKRYNFERNRWVDQSYPIDLGDLGDIHATRMIEGSGSVAFYDSGMKLRCAYDGERWTRINCDY